MIGGDMSVYRWYRLVNLRRRKLRRFTYGELLQHASGAQGEL